MRYAHLTTRIERILEPTEPAPLPPPAVFLQMNYGEDEDKHIQEWLSSHDGRLSSGHYARSRGSHIHFILTQVLGDPPRPEYTSRESLLNALPTIAQGAARKGQRVFDLDKWRPLAARYGVEALLTEAQ